MIFDLAGELRESSKTVTKIAEPQFAVVEDLIDIRGSSGAALRGMGRALRIATDVIITMSLYASREHIPHEGGRRYFAGTSNIKFPQKLSQSASVVFSAAIICTVLIIHGPAYGNE